jgi:hypothetical protein
MGYARQTSSKYRFNFPLVALSVRVCGLVDELFEPLKTCCDRAASCGMHVASFLLGRLGLSSTLSTYCF